MTDDTPDLRASDADRDRVAEVLRDALAEGRLDMAEFEERLDAAYAARTYGELAPLIRDLPAGAAATEVPTAGAPAGTGGRAGRITGGEGSSAWAVAVLSGFQRKGRWRVPKRFNCFVFCGGGEIDLREADFAGREVVVNCVAIMGGVNVVVPPGVEVHVRGLGVMGGFDQGEEGVPGDPGAPRVIVTGFAFWGGVGVERKVTRAERRRLKEERRRERLERGEARRGLDASARDDVRDVHRWMPDGHRAMPDGHRDGRGDHGDRQERRPRGED
ncbi:DUF1707 SHOCT-like domain-containing protein [Streptomyces daghestanicus]|uniref:DUF1707 domain-containing protein n=1 Tax=Streptomyces daghestanicus TaxID=66885 RepID=A0ABQ3Q9J8_9ACTN|nr:DUF1707 domain-containing protein [Streptomyces daghestanicus]GGU35058.1 hypothetical protein GCM10010259_26940 [Streptomyces daghestanicus]GHI33961.1 hypothetical protein Sdagh_56910 [Streptomyces daghestanicus]